MMMMIFNTLGCIVPKG